MGPFLLGYIVMLTEADVRNVLSCRTSPLFAIMAWSGTPLSYPPSKPTQLAELILLFSSVYLPVLSIIHFIICVGIFIRIGGRNSIMVFCLIQDLVLLVVFLRTQTFVTRPVALLFPVAMFRQL
jgi:hypothetical protein